MSVFILGAVLAFCLIWLLMITKARAFYHRDGRPILASYKFGKFGEIRILVFLQRLALFILGLAILAVIVVIVYGQISDDRASLYSAFSLITSDASSRFLLGLIFGAVFAVWVQRILKAPPEQKTLTLQQKVEGIALFLLFVVGVSSVTVDDFLRGFQLSKEGIRFALPSQGEPVSRGGQGDETKAAIQPQAGQGSNSQSQYGNSQESGLGVTIARSLAGFIARDAFYASRRMGDRRSCNEIVQAFEDSDGGSGKGAPTRDADATYLRSVAELCASSANYSAHFAPLAQCVDDLIEVTGDRSHFAGLLVGLKPEIRNLFDLSIGLRRGAIQENDARLSAAEDALSTKLNSLAHSVSDSALLLVAANGSQPYREATWTPDEWLALRARLEGCGARFSRDAGPVQPPNITRAQADRPYFAMLYSGILQLDRQPEAGIEALQTWLNSEPDGASTMLNPWYRIRLMSTQVLLFQDLLTRYRPRAPNSLVDNYIKLLERYMVELKGLDEVREGYGQVFYNPAINLVPEGFENERVDLTDKCNNPPSRSSVFLSMALFSAITAYVDRVVEHPDFIGAYSKSASNLLDENLKANFNCVFQEYVSILMEWSRNSEAALTTRQIESSTNQYRETIALLRAELLLAYARFQYAIFEEKRPIGIDYNAWAGKRLSVALEALNLGMSVIDPYGNPHKQDQARRNTPFRLKVTKAMYVWDDIDRFSKNIRETLHKLN